MIHICKIYAHELLNIFMWGKYMPAYYRGIQIMHIYVYGVTWISLDVLS